ncbi:BZ3500_MvSof-1268-A1-R1_Chr9g10599 [Microbotryum saponariae]|uniref:BZ3500_MvSof-1268-A1-R1_Chr9g10599 protein n=1 Tax=Microbotryum saponariae TaxID=289078 RepID=A0A2X0LV34_9BASI|nr:BZ3501_MvSof-1269-A2-R1_Chr9g10347 [Microbotryum saponariae]SDA00365.1 BZ3500_MvSof-1268-A1-R1_Chr9g10599 [Microbotryum saponariae]
MRSGCALGIADVDDINKVTMDNLVIFSTLQKCGASPYNDFEIPALMPACTGAKCICVWFCQLLHDRVRLRNHERVEQCKDDRADFGLKFCPKLNTTCTQNLPSGAKRPRYAYNTPSNVVFVGNDDRPGYQANWGFSLRVLRTISSNAASTEWVTFGQGQGACFSLTWSDPVTFNQIVLYDRPNPQDRTLTATITFADGSSVPISSLNNQGTAMYFNTTTITTTLLKLNILPVSGATANIGLAEIQVFFRPTIRFIKILTPTPKSSKRSVVAFAPVAPRHPRDFSMRRDTLQERIFEEASGSRLAARDMFAN